MDIFQRSVCQTAVTMLAYLPANPMVEDNESDMFENLIPRSIEHFACSVLMDMQKDTFQFLEAIKPEMVNTIGKAQRSADELDRQITPSLIPADVTPDEQMTLRMAAGKVMKQKVKLIFHKNC